MSIHTLQQHLQRAPHMCAEDWLLSVIRDLDLMVEAEPVLVRMVSAGLVRAGAERYLLTTFAAAVREAQSAEVRATRVAAVRYLEQPAAETWDALYRAATTSYPFGPGEGCHAVAALGGHGTPGSGCRSGIGWLWSLSQTIGIPPVMSELIAALAPLIGLEDGSEHGAEAVTVAAHQESEPTPRLSIDGVLWSHQPVPGRFTTTACVSALPDGARLPTRWECLALLRAAGVEIVKGPWAVDLGGLQALGLQLPPLTRIQDRERSAWWIQPSSGEADLFVPYETQNHQHFAFKRARTQERAWVWPVWSTARTVSPVRARALILELESLADVERRQRAAALASVLESLSLFVDSRDGRAYRTISIGGQTWLADSIRAPTAGSWPMATADLAGRYYTRQAAAEACPPGCRLPTTAEWEAVLRRFGNLSLDAHPTPAALYTAVTPGGRSGLDLQAQGLQHDWVLDFTPEELGIPLATEEGMATFWSAEGEIVLTPTTAYHFDPAPSGGELRPVRCVLSSDARSAR